jgi:hypothetical protein
MKILIPIILLAINLSSCRFDDKGNLSIAPWFWYALIIFVIVIIIGAVLGRNDMKQVEESLKKKGLKFSDFKKCGTYVGGHSSIDETIEGIAIRKDKEILKIYEFPTQLKMPKYRAEIPIDKITEIKVEDASSIQRKLTVGRLLLVGIFAFAWKKKKKDELAFVTIEWKEKFEHNTIFSFEGKDAMQNANTVRNQLIKLCTDN